CTHVDFIGNRFYFASRADVRFRNSASISSKLRPRVSGRYLITKIKAPTPTAAKIKKTSPTTSTPGNIGNNCATNKLPIDKDSAEIPDDAPRPSIGNKYRSGTHRTGTEVK